MSTLRKFPGTLVPGSGAHFEVTYPATPFIEDGTVVDGVVDQAFEPQAFDVKSAGNTALGAEPGITVGNGASDPHFQCLNLQPNYPPVLFSVFVHNTALWMMYVAPMYSFYLTFCVSRSIGKGKESFRAVLWGNTARNIFEGTEKPRKQECRRGFYLLLSIRLSTG